MEIHEIEKPTVVAISRNQTRVPGAHVVVKKPITDQGAAQSLKAAYHRMLHDYRRHARHAVMMPVVATEEKQGSVSIMVTDIGDGGLGISTKEPLSIGKELGLRLKLPQTPSGDFPGGASALDPGIRTSGLRVRANSACRRYGPERMAEKPNPREEASSRRALNFEKWLWFGSQTNGNRSALPEDPPIFLLIFVLHVPRKAGLPSSRALNRPEDWPIVGVVSLRDLKLDARRKRVKMSLFFRDRASRAKSTHSGHRSRPA